jgi:hypothetical protein
MGPKTETKTIGGREFTVTALTGWSSFKTSRRLGAILGPTLGRAFSGIGTLSLDSLMQQDVGELLKSVGSALEGFFDKLTEAELEGLTRTLLANATVKEDGQDVPVIKGFDLVFQGQAAQIWELLTFAIEVNYGDFFELLASLAKAFGVRSKNDQQKSKSSQTE